MKITWPRFWFAYFVLALIVAYPVALYAEDGHPDSQVSRPLRTVAAQDLFTDNSPQPGLTPTQPELLPETAPAPATVPVTAVAPTATTFSVDVSTIVTGIFGILGALVAVFVPIIATRLMGVLKINKDSALATIVESALRNGLNLGLAKAQAASKDWTKINVHNEILADGLAYVYTHAGDELASLGIPQQAVIEKLQSRLAAATNTVNKLPTVVAAVPPAS